MVSNAIELVFLLHHDPHVDTVIAQCQGKNEIKLIASNLAKTFPPGARVLGGCLCCERSAETGG